MRGEVCRIGSICSFLFFVRYRCLCFYDRGGAVIEKRYGFERNLVKENIEDTGGVGHFYSGHVHWAGNLEWGRNVIGRRLCAEVVHKPGDGGFLVFVCVHGIFDRAAFFKSYSKDH